MDYLDPYDKCGLGCVARPPLLDTAGGREHDACPEVRGCDDHDICTDPDVKI
jgi:hypothetical protein